MVSYCFEKQWNATFLRSNLLEKQGFSAPDQSWFKRDSYGMLKKIYNPKATLYNMLDFKSTTKLVDEHINGEQEIDAYLFGDY